MIEIDWSKYEAPINVDYTTRELEKQFEKDVLKVTASYNINVNVDELVKALHYDRNQYEQGYKAGYEKGYHDAQNIRYFVKSPNAKVKE